MPFIAMELGRVGEQYAAPSGQYDLVVLKAEEAASKKLKEQQGDDAEPNMLVVTLGIQSDEHPDAAPFRAWFTYPEEGGEYNDMRIRELKRFLYWFNIPFEDNGFDTDNLEGATAQGIQVNKLVNDDTGREFNEMELDPIPNEGEGDAGGDEGVAEEEAPEEETEEEVAEEEAPEEEVLEEEQPEEEAEPEEEAPAPRARAAARPVSKTATKAAPKAATRPVTGKATKAAPKAAAKVAPKGKGGRR